MKLVEVLNKLYYNNCRWVVHLKRALTVQAKAIEEYLLIWDLVEDVVLQHDVQDQCIWKLSILGIYTSKSAYKSFVGNIRFAPYKKNLEIMGSSMLWIFHMVSCS